MQMNYQRTIKLPRTCQVKMLEKGSEILIIPTFCASFLSAHLTISVCYRTCILRNRGWNLVDHLFCFTVQEWENSEGGNTHFSQIAVAAAAAKSLQSCLTVRPHSSKSQFSRWDLG